jgi:hypothetical protein
MLFMSIGRGCVSELRPPTGLLFIAQVIYECEKPWCNDINNGEPKTSEKNLYHCHFVKHKYHPGANPGLRGERPATNGLSHGTASKFKDFYRYNDKYGKGKAVPLHAMEALGGRGGIAPTHSHSRPRN